MIEQELKIDKTEAFFKKKRLNFTQDFSFSDCQTKFWIIKKLVGRCIKHYFTAVNSKDAFNHKPIGLIELSGCTLACNSKIFNLKYSFKISLLISQIH